MLKSLLQKMFENSLQNTEILTHDDFQIGFIQNHNIILFFKFQSFIQNKTMRESKSKYKNFFK